MGEQDALRGASGQPPLFLEFTDALLAELEVRRNGRAGHADLDRVAAGQNRDHLAAQELEHPVGDAVLVAVADARRPLALAGVMGGGIAELASRSGIQVRLRDVLKRELSDDARQALEMGLVNTVVPLERLEEEWVSSIR